MASLWLLHDYPRFARTFLRVKEPEYGRLVPLRLKPVQQAIDQTLDALLERRRPARVQVLKARRVGISTEVAGRFTHRITTRPHQRGQVIAHRGPDAETIFSIYERMHANLPEVWQGLPFRPHRAGSRHKVLAFPALDSSLEVGSAQSEGIGRGGDLQLVHLSEAAFFPDPAAFLAALLPQLPATGDGIVVLESTSNGPEGWWHETWRQSKDGVSGYTPLFFAWWHDPGYRLAPGVPAEAYTEEEQELAVRYGVDSEQLAWLRYQLEVTCFGSVGRRRREFPSCEEDAWVSVGEVAWPTELLFPCYQRKEMQWRGELLPSGIAKDPDGHLFVWEEPQAQAEYVCGVDVAAGLKEGNLCTAEVFRVGRRPGEWPVQVAEWAGRHQDPVTFAQTLTLLGHYYQKALLAVEVTGIGRPTQTALQKTFFYPRLHRWIPFDSYKPRGDTWGWECVAPEALVPTADLRWVPAGRLKPGEFILGCHETPLGGRGTSNPFRLQQVVATRLFTAPVVDVTLENGQRTRVSATHPFWVGTPRETQWRWVLAMDLRPGQVVKYLSPWGELRTYDAGRLSAFLDGEGHFSQHHSSGFDLLISQAQGELADDICRLWIDVGFPAITKWLRHKKRPQEKPVLVSGVRQFPEVLRALGSLRPTRLLRKFCAADLGCRTLKALPNVPIQRAEPGGEDVVVGVTTEPDHTLIADGIVGHNTTWKSKEVMHGIADWLLRTQHVTLRSPALLEELVNYQQVGPEEYRGVKGDDRIMGAMIAWVSWFQHCFAGVPLKDLRKTLVTLYGAATPMEGVAAISAQRSPREVEWTEGRLLADPAEQPWRPRRRESVLVEDW